MAERGTVGKMERRLNELVRYRGDRLFEGAVDVSWLIQDRQKAAAAACAYVFHGPSYHGVSQSDVGTHHGHRLIDTASFTSQIARRCAGIEEVPFSLAIAGYGTGKSHLATTLSILLSEPTSETSETILDNLRHADHEMCEDVCRQLNSMSAPTLVIALNGMGNFDLTSEVTRQVAHYLRVAGIDTKAIDELRPRFTYAARLMEAVATAEQRSDLARKCGLNDEAEVYRRLLEHDEGVYSVAHDYLATLGWPIKAIGDETVKDVIDTVCREYIGEDKPFGRLLILFDEFGRYAEFATIRSHVAGSGVLQQLFEGVQEHADKATFVAFIQFDLNTYVQRIGREYQNEILRVATRYESAEKAYLSINLETLIANLLEKDGAASVMQELDDGAEVAASHDCMKRLNRWFPQSSNHRVWNQADTFHRIVRKGCWPLSPYATWLLFHLAAGGQHLQQRSALSLLGDAVRNHSSSQVDDAQWLIDACGIWSTSLEKEFLIAEDEGTRGSIAHAYSTVLARTEHALRDDEQRVLRAVVLASKLGLVAQDKNDALVALSALSGLSPTSTADTARYLEEERNVLSWDESFNQFDILSDSGPPSKFRALLRQRVADAYDSRKKAQLFQRRAREWAPDVLADVPCDFAETNDIATQEWIFTAAVTNLEELPRTLDEATQSWQQAVAVDQPRGTIVYCYVEPETDLSHTQTQTSLLLQNLAKSSEVPALPTVVVFLHDDGSVGQILAELTVLTEQLTEQEKASFRNLIGAHREKSQALLLSSLSEMIKQRHYVAWVPGDIRGMRLSTVCSEVFAAVYPQVVPFPFDGFSTPRGNAADTCHVLTLELVRGHLTWEMVNAKPAKDKNRAKRVLKDCWQVFAQNGDVTRRPQHTVVRTVFTMWDEMMQGCVGGIHLIDLLRPICRPPFGANMASAGLLLGVYLCPRSDVLAIRKDGAQLELQELTDALLFRGKHLDVSKLQQLQLVSRVAGEQSRWVSFLDEWESAVERSYSEQVEFLARSQELKRSEPVPKAHSYRLSLLETKASEAQSRLSAVDDSIGKAFSIIESAERRGDLHRLTFGALRLQRVAEDILSDSRYDQDRASDLQCEVARVRQLTIQSFDMWLREQRPNGNTAAAATDFERLMRETCSNLSKLELSEQKAAAEQYTDRALRLIDLFAEAESLATDIQSWLIAHDPERMLRVAELRACMEAAVEYDRKADELLRQVESSRLRDGKEKLAFLNQMARRREQSFVQRASTLWDREFSIDGVGSMLTEARDLERAYEGCDADVTDFRIMCRALQLYRDAYTRLLDQNVPQQAFESLFAELSGSVDAELSQEEAPPWIPTEVLPLIKHAAEENREGWGADWLARMEDEVASVQGSDTARASNLFSRLQQEPAYLTDSQREASGRLLSQVRDYLNTLKVEWLVSEYEQLDANVRDEFLKRIGFGQESTAKKRSWF